MNEPKFTPGPWSVDRSRKTSINKGEKHIAMVNFCNSADADLCVCGQEHDANTSLIAAAPDMYESLKNICEGCHCGDVVFREDTNPDCESCKIGNLLKKARGEKC